MRKTFQEATDHGDHFQCRNLTAIAIREFPPITGRIPIQNNIVAYG